MTGDRRSTLAAALFAVLVLGAGLGALGALRSGSTTSPVPDRYRGSEPPPGIHAPDFELLSYRGHVVRMRALRGKVVLVTFLDTECRTKCPIIASAIGDALRLLAPPERRGAAALALTVDPRTDTPTSARVFLARRHALGKLDFLLGTIKEMRPIWRAFHVLAAAETGDADVHSADVRVFDRDGVWVSTLHSGVDLTPPSLAHDIRVALRGAPDTVSP